MDGEINGLRYKGRTRSMLASWSPVSTKLETVLMGSSVLTGYYVTQFQHTDKEIRFVITIIYDFNIK